MSPRWQDADEAVESLAATLVAAATRTAQRGVGKGPRGRTRSKRHPKNTRRHIAEVIRSHRLAPGLRVDRNMVAALLIGHRDLVTNPVLVVAVAQACDIIAGRKLSAKKAARMRAASVRVAELIARAEADTRPVPASRAENAPPAVSPSAPAPVEPVPVEPVPVDAVPVDTVPGPVEAVQQAVPAQARPAPAPVQAVSPPCGGSGTQAAPGVRPRAGRPVAVRRRRHVRRRWWLACAVLLLLVVVAVLALG